MTPEQDTAPRPPSPPENEPHADDALWRDLLSDCLDGAIRSVLPELANAVDETRPIEFKNTELRRLARFTRRYSATPPDSPRFVDILADIPLKGGESARVLLHVEVQGRGGSDFFPRRMHLYRSLLEGRYGRPVLGLALLVQPIGEKQSEGYYEWSMFGSRVTYEYPVFRLYEGDEEALRESNNPFDLAHYAAIVAWKHRTSDEIKLARLKLLLKELDKRGWSDEKKALLLWFFEGIFRIETDEAWDLWEEELEQRKEDGVVYVSLTEKKGIEKGKEEGLEIGKEIGKGEGILIGKEEGKLETALRMLRGGLSIADAARFADLPEDEVTRLAEESR